MARKTKKPKNRIGMMFGLLGLQKFSHTDDAWFDQQRSIPRSYQKHLLKYEY